MGRDGQKEEPSTPKGDIEYRGNADERNPHVR